MKFDIFIDLTNLACHHLGKTGKFYFICLFSFKYLICSDGQSYKKLYKELTICFNVTKITIITLRTLQLNQRKQ